MQIEINQRWRSNPGHRAWTVKGIDGKRVTLIRSPSGVKSILIASLRSLYMLVGSDREKQAIEAWQRHKWKIADDIK